MAHGRNQSGKDASKEQIKTMKKKPTDAIVKASEAKPHRTAKGPEPERLKITGFRNWENAVSAAMRKPKPPSGWPK